MSVKPERRSGASPAEVANKKPVKGVPIESCKGWYQDDVRDGTKSLYQYQYHFSSNRKGRGYYPPPDGVKVKMLKIELDYWRVIA